MKTIYKSSKVELKIGYDSKNDQYTGASLRIGNTTIDSIVIPNYLKELKKAIEAYDIWVERQTKKLGEMNFDT